MYTIKGDNMENKQTEENSTEVKAPTKQRKWWFRCLKKLMKGRYKEPIFVYLDKENFGFGNGSIILSNSKI